MIATRDRVNTVMVYLFLKLYCMKYEAGLTFDTAGRSLWCPKNEAVPCSLWCPKNEAVPTVPFLMARCKVVLRTVGISGTQANTAFSHRARVRGSKSRILKNPVPARRKFVCVRKERS
jgi:hypothetical protein